VVQGPRILIGALVAAIAVGGCGGAGDRGDARAVVQRFYAAVDRHDGAAACAQLSASTAQALADERGRPCRSAVTGLDLQGGAVARVQVYITSAQVDLHGGETAFLDRGAGGWRISAVGCRPDQGPPSDTPMDCEAQA
jgi:hypothetical protein